jgi:hypothetical protein
MRNTEETFNEMEKMWEDFKTNHHSDTKISNKRARKNIGELKKVITEYRKASVQEEKN